MLRSRLAFRNHELPPTPACCWFGSWTSGSAFGKIIADYLADNRRGKNTQLPPPDLLRQSIYNRLAGYEDLYDAERLSRTRSSA